MEEGRRLQRISRTSKDPVRLRRAIVVLMSASPALLVEAVRAAQRGDALISPAVTVRLLRQLEDGRRPSAAGGPLGLWDSAHWGTAMVLALAILAVQAVFSRWWLSRFRYGPLEWGLRCVTWWSVVQLRRWRP
jgi:hypothetical protein